MAKFQLFRIRVDRPRQKYLLDDDVPAAEAIDEAIRQKPSGEFYAGTEWHIGNVEPIDEHAIYFAIGKVSERPHEQWDESEKKFLEQEFDVAPYTHAIVDLSVGQLCAIAAKSRVASPVMTIADRLQRLLNESGFSKEYGYHFSLRPLNNPKPFVEQLRDAHRIRKLSVTFGRPNFQDAERDWQEPFERFLEDLDGDEGKTSVEGDDLDKEAAESVSRDAASAGENVTAQFIQDAGQKPVTRSLRDNPIETEGEADTTEGRRDILERVRNLYSSISE